MRPKSIRFWVALYLQKLTFTRFPLWSLPINRERWRPPPRRSGFCEQRKQKTREVLYLKALRAYFPVYVWNLYRRLRRHFPHRGKQENLKFRFATQNITAARQYHFAKQNITYKSPEVAAICRNLGAFFRSSFTTFFSLTLFA